MSISVRPGEALALLGTSGCGKSSGLRLALAQAWLFLVAAELLGASMGLGFLLSDSGTTGRIDRILLAIILLALLGKFTDAILGVFEKWAIKKWA